MIPSREKSRTTAAGGTAEKSRTVGRPLQKRRRIARKKSQPRVVTLTRKSVCAGTLHDIGRTFGVRHLGHVSDGYSYMKKIGCDEVAKVCLTHSFATQTLEEYIGKCDVSEDELSMIRTELEKSVYDDYDRLVQLCDSIAGAEGVL